MNKFHFATDEEIVGLDQELCAKLDIAWGIANAALRPTEVRFRLTSTTRGIHCGHSAHALGLAVDIGLGHLAEGFERDTQRWAIMHGLHGAGFKRIEEAPAHLHVDCGQPPDFPSPVQWIGKDA